MTLDYLKQRGLVVGEEVRNAIRVIEEGFGGELTHDSGHKQGPTWIYTFPRHGRAQIALRINREKLSVYLRATPHGRTDFEHALPDLGVVQQNYPNAWGTNPVNGLLSEDSAHFLTPHRGRLIRFAPHPSLFNELLENYLGGYAAANGIGDIGLHGGGHGVADVPAGSGPGASDVDPETLSRRLDRNSAMGRAGERIAYMAELERLRKAGCPDPVACVMITADINVAAGYDLRSEWNSKLRCIEVKTSTRVQNDFFLTENECLVLTKLGPQAWIYRVEVDADLKNGLVVLQLQNPMACIAPELMRPVVWRVSGSAVADLS